MIAAGRAVSFLGDEVALLAMAFRAKDELGHFGVAAILIAGALPLLVLAPVSGLLVDRVRTRPLLVAVASAQAAVCVGLAWSSTAMLVPLVALLACGTSIASPAWAALLPTIVRDDQLSRAMGIVQSASACAGIAGPFAGGVLVASFGFHVPLLADAASFAVLAVVAAVLRVDRVPAVGHAALSVREAMAGIRVCASHPVIRSLLVLATCLVLTLGVVNVVEIYFITTALHAGPRGYGLLGLAMGTGMVVAGALSGPIAARVPSPERLFVIGCVVLCAGIGAFGLTDQLWQAVVILCCCGMANAVVNVNVSVLVVRHTDPALRGRVFAAVQGTVSAAQIVSLAVGGALLLAVAPRPIILVGAACAIVVLGVTVTPLLRSHDFGAGTVQPPADEPIAA